MTNITIIRKTKETSRQNSVTTREYTTVSTYREYMRQFLHAEGNKIVDDMSEDNMLFALLRCEMQKFGTDVVSVTGHIDAPVQPKLTESAKFMDGFFNGGAYDDEQMHHGNKADKYRCTDFDTTADR